MFFSNLFKPQGIGIDIGTDKIVIYLDKKGVVLNEPTVISINTKNNQVIAIGQKAKEMIGRVPSYIDIIKPIENGVISNFEATEKMIDYFMKKIRRDYGNFLNSQALISIPLDITEVERKAVDDVILTTGIKNIYTIDKCIATAIGNRLKILDSIGNFVVEFGAGRTEIATISTGGIMAYKSIPFGSKSMDHNIISYIRDKFSILIGETTAENIKKNIGTTIENKEKKIKVKGRDLATGMPKEVIVTNIDISNAIDKSIETIVANIEFVLEATPPEILNDIYEKGIILSGGGSLIDGLKERITKQTKITTYTADDPSMSSIRGIGIVLGDMSKYKDICTKMN